MGIALALGVLAFFAGDKGGLALRLVRGAGTSLPVFVKDCAECPELVLIPAGKFDMGPGDDDKGDMFPYARPVHRVHVSPFQLARTEVTRGEFAAFVRDTGYQAKGCRTWNGLRWEQQDARSWESPGFAQDDRHPVVCIAWKDAIAYIQWLSRKAGTEYRLPSEAEWEYAARAGTATARHWGAASDQACKFANVGDKTARDEILRSASRASHTCSDGYVYTAPVGSFAPNAFGLYDMIGNAWEWTADCWHPNYDGAPVHGEVWDSTPCNSRVLRGGSWISQPGTARSAVRLWDFDGVRGDGRGFRIAKTLQTGR
ncbi:MAG: formylglycine-generating enzyme family protein [Rhodocyclaceae bacterium]|nr:formylglycine-generating enzyme family protein [Rhodocyclaceae bacterium]